MKIIVIGASGTIGREVVSALAARHEVVRVTRHSEPAVDITKPSSITALFRAVPDADAVVSCAGGAVFKPLDQLTPDDFEASLHDKLMGQVNVARAALDALRPNGSITLTSGVLAQKPMVGSGAVSLVNAALEGFGRAAALEAKRGIRVNVVSPPWIDETLKKFNLQAEGALSSPQVARAYVAAVEGSQRGEVLDPRRFV